MGIGQATVAVPMGSESVWSNPALIALSPRELSLDFKTKAIATEPESDLAAAFVFPVRYVGALAVFARYMDYGSQPATDTLGNTTGSFNITDLVFGASAATTFFDRLSVGFTAKALQTRFPCTGDCSQVPSDQLASAIVSALDLGVQYFVLRDSSLSIGGAATTFGPRFQQIDREQADSLPSRFTVGASYARAISSVPGLRLRVSADLVSRVAGGGIPGERFGAELTYLNRLYMRGGYIAKGPGEINTPTIGFGVSSGRMHIDFAQMMAALGTQNARPTFFALRYTF